MSDVPSWDSTDLEKLEKKDLFEKRIQGYEQLLEGTRGSNVDLVFLKYF